MSREINALYVSKDGTSCAIPCCADFEDRVEFWLDDDESFSMIYVTLSTPDGLWRRLKSAWRELTGKRHRDSVIMHTGTVIALRDWLSERIEKFPSSP